MVIEDEPLAQQAFLQSLGRLASLQVLAVFANAIDAFDQLPQLSPDVLFVDVQLPELSGLDFLRAYPQPCPHVILVTAHPGYALEGFEIGALDYLLKPVSMDRLLRAINRVRERMLSQAPAHVITTNEPAPTYIYVKTDKRLEQIFFEQIVFIEGLGDYVKIHLAQRVVVTHLTLTKLQESLPSDHFIRISRSYIVGLFHLKLVDGHSLVLSTGHQVTIGPHYREQVRQRLRPWLLE